MSAVSEAGRGPAASLAELLERYRRARTQTLARFRVLTPRQWQRSAATKSISMNAKARPAGR